MGMWPKELGDIRPRTTLTVFTPHPMLLPLGLGRSDDDATVEPDRGRFPGRHP